MHIHPHRGTTVLGSVLPSDKPERLCGYRYTHIHPHRGTTVLGSVLPSDKPERLCGYRYTHIHPHRGQQYWAVFYPLMCQKDYVVTDTHTYILTEEQQYWAVFYPLISQKDYVVTGTHTNVSMYTYVGV